MSKAKSAVRDDSRPRLGVVEVRAAPANGPGEKSRKDEVFRENERAVDFTFNAKVAGVFDDMVSRSVPFYNEVQRMQVEFAAELLPDEPCLVYDLGCSTGTTIDLLASHPSCPRSAHFVGVDNSTDMLAKAREKLAPLGDAGRVELISGDLAQLDLKPCSLVIMNWTLQFVRPIYRQSLVQRVCDAIRPGGALFLSEKTLVSDSQLNRLYIDFYLRYKRRQGYTDDELSRKREALENVLVPYRHDENVALLRQCGFETVDTYFRWFNFECLVAKKRG